MVAMNVWPTDAADGSVANEARWRKMARHWVPTGVCAGVGAQMLPSLAGANLTVKAGACWVDGHFCELPGDQVLTSTANGLAVVRFDPAANSAQLLYLDGVSAPSQSPTGVYELAIAKITGSVLADQRTLVGGAQKQWDMPWGVQGVAVSALNVGGQQPTIDVVNAVVPSLVANRRLQVTAYLNVTNGGAQNQMTGYITDVANATLLIAGWTVPASFSAIHVMNAYLVSAAGGPFTFKARLGGTAPWAISGSAIQSHSIAVVDIGPAGPPLT